MMAAPVVLVLVARNSVVEGNLAGESALGQQLEGAVYGGVADAGIFFLDQAVQFIDGQVVAGFKERAQDGVALRRLLQADALEMLVENPLRFAYHLARDGRLVIDALLRHEGSG
jgi:hypothetical protein